MSELYGRLSRLFPEVSPLYTLPLKKRKAKKQLSSTTNLFAEPTELGYIQILPGLFDERPRTASRENHCFFVLDAPEPMLFPGTTADFAEAEFRFPLYQIPFFAGLTDTPNIDQTQAVDTFHGELLNHAGQLDSALQNLIRLVAGSSLPPALARTLIEQLRVWTVEDYVKPAYLKHIGDALSELTNQVYAYPPPTSEAKPLKEQIASGKKMVKALLTQATHQHDPWETFAEGLLEAMPRLRTNNINNTLHAYIKTPNDQRVLLTNQIIPNNEWQNRLSTKFDSLDNLYINNSYTIFAQSQLW